MNKNARGIRSIHRHETGAHALRDEFRRKRRLTAGWIPKRSPIAHLVALALGAGLAAPAAAQVVANGRTATTVTTSGNITDVTTATTRGVNAFNAFSQFVVNGGHVANLHLPGSTRNLINLVDSKVRIDGTLNSLYSSGKIGGNVFFASPQGFVVGADGIVNVGKLSVSTPTADFMDQMIDAGGHIGDAAVNQFLAGNAPQSADGLITIQGRVNALNGVVLQGRQVSVDAAAHIVSGDAARALIAVNVGDAADVAMVEENGAIRIVSAGDVDVSGYLHADGTQGAASGGILITAENDVRLSGAHLNATAGGDNTDGGEILVWGDRNAHVDNTVLESRGRGEGAGGFIEVSANDEIVVRDIRVDTASEAGLDGRFLIDPAQLTIVGRQDYNGTHAEWVADDKITVAGDAVINTRKIADGDDRDTADSTGDSGNITIKAANIDVQSGAQLLAFVEEGSAHKAGDITLEAVREGESATTNIDVAGTLRGGDVTIKAKATDKRGSGQATAKASVTISGTIEAKNISATADATAESKYTNDLVDMIAMTGAGALTGLNLSTVAAEADASVTIASGASLEATENITLHADATRVAATPALNITGRQVGATAVLGDLTGTTTVKIASGASVEADGRLEAEATSVNEIDISAFTITDPNGTSYFAGTLAYSQADVTTDADIDAGATIKVGHVGLHARNENSFSTSATAMANGAGKAGAAAAISDIKVHTSATLGADLAGANGTGNLLVLAENYTKKNKTSASTATGSGAAMRILGSATGGIGSFIQQKAGSASDKVGGKVDSGSPLKLAAALALSEVDLDARAAIADGVEIDATGDVAVLAKLEDAGVRNNAIAETNAQLNQGGSDGNIAVAAAVAVGQFEHNAQATIGKNVRVNAKHIGVGADAVMPITITWHKWEGLDSIISKVNTNLGLLNEVLTSYASASGDSGELGLFGATNYFENENNVRAWVGEGATLTATGNRDDWTTSYVDLKGDTKSWIWKEAVDVQARSLTESIDVAGNINFLNPIGGTSSGSGGVSVGAAFNWIEHSAETIAGIGNGVNVTTSGLGVNASTEDRMFVVSPTSGAGGGFGGNGIVALSQIDNLTHASISNEANITADVVTLDAAQGLSVWSAAGSLSREESAAVGIAIAVNDISTDTRAYIGDNDEDDPEGAGTDGAKGTLTTDSVAVSAITDGMVGTFAVAGAVASSDDPDAEPGLVDRTKTKISNGVNSLRNGAANKLDGLPLLGKLADSVRAKEGAGANNTQPSKPPFGIGVSGASTVNMSEMNTSAFIDGVTIDSRSAGQTDVLARAVTNADLISGAGGAALAAANNPSSKFSAGVAGAVAFNQLDNDTYAGIKNTTINDAGAVKVEALSAGDQISVGLGIALNTSQDQSKAGVAAGSVSLTRTENSTKAEIANSTIKGDGSGDDTVDVTAYDRTHIANGGGSFTYGGKVGVGAAISYADINNSVEAIVDSGQLTDLDSVSVSALSASRVVNAAAMGGYGAESNSLTGSFVFTDVDKDVLATVRNGAQLDTDGDVSVVASGAGRDSNLDALLTVDRDNDVDFSLDRGDAEPAEPDQLIADGRPGADQGGEAILGVAGLVGAGKNNLGISFVEHDISTSYVAAIESSTVTAGGDVTVGAQDATQLIGVAAGIGVATDKFAGVGSAVANVTSNNVEARIGAEDASAPDTSVTGANIDVIARNSAEIYAGAGNLAISKNTAAGAAVAYNETGNSTKAIVNDATLNAGAGKVTLDALSVSTIRALAASGAGSQNVAIGGSLNINEIDDTIQASLSGSTVTASSLDVVARDRDDDSDSKSSIWSLAGNVSGASKVAVGLAASVNTVSNTIDAAVDGSTLTIAGATNVDADAGSEIYSIAVAGSGAGNVAAGASDSTNTVTNSVTARFNNSSLNDGAGTGSLNVTAGDRLEDGSAGAKIWSLAGNVSGAGKVAVGLAASVNTVTNTLAADISGNSNITLDGAVNVEADSATEIKTMAVAGGGAGTASVQGSGTVNTIVNTVRAKISGASTQITASALDVLASERDDASGHRTSIWSLAGAAGGAGTASIGASVAVNTVSNTLNAEIDGGTYSIDGATNVNADAGTEIMTMAVGGGGAGTVAAGASVATNTISNDVAAKVANATVTDGAGSAGSLTVTASERLDDGDNGTQIWALAGNVQGAGTTSVGVASAVNTIANELYAQVIDSTVDVGGDVKVAADSASEIKSAAVAGGGAGTASINGSVAVNTIANTVAATVSKGSIEAANLSVTASEREGTDRTTIHSLAGAVSGAGTAAVGAATAVNTIANNLDAVIDGANVDVSTGSVAVESFAGSDIKSAAAAGGGSGTAAVTGAVTVNTIANEANALTSNATIAAAQLDVRAIDVMADGSAGSLIQSLAGNVNGAGTASVGLASAVNTISNKVEAGIDGSTLTVSTATNVEAKEKAKIETLAADGGGAGTAAVGGSATVNNIANTTRAGISGSSNTGSANKTSIASSDTSSIDSIAGAIRVGGNAGVGAATSVNRIGNTVEAYLSGNRSGNAYQAKNVVLDAASDADIRTIALGVAAGGNAGVAGSVATNILDTEVTSRIDGGALVQADNNVGVLAENSDRIEVVAGAAGIGGMNAGVALSTAVNVIESQTVAKIAGATTQVTALGKDASDKLTLKSGELDQTPDVGDTPDADSFAWYDLEGKTERVSGMAVNAFSTQQVGSVSASVGGTAPNPKGSAAVGATADVNVLSGATRAYVDGAKINKANTGAGVDQDVDVRAASHSYSTAFVAGAAVSGDAAVGGAIDTAVISRTTSAYAKDADITAADGVNVGAQSGQGARAIGASAGGAIVGGAGTGLVAVLSGTTEAYLDNTVVRSIDLDVNATSRSGINLMGGALAIGGGAAGGALSVGVSDQTTRAFIDGGEADVSGKVAVQANADTRFWNLSVSGAGGLVAGLAGMASVNVVSNTTEAFLKNTSIGESGAKADAVTVAADDDVEVRSYGGALGVSVAPGAGVGAAANVTVVQSRVAAQVENSNVYANNALSVSATSSVDAEHVTASAGLSTAFGTAGSASLILVGNGTSGEAMSELNQDGDGLLQRAFELTSGEKVSESDGLDDNQKDVLNDSDAQESRAALAALDADRADRLSDMKTSLSEGADGELEQINDRSRYDSSKHFSASADSDVTLATITGGIIDVGSVSVEATDSTRTSNISGAAGVGGTGLGIGGGVAITRVYNDVQATLAASNVSTGSAHVTAKALNGSGESAHALAFAGGAGPVGLGAAWADAYVENDVLASVNGDVVADDAVTIKAEDTTSAKAEAVGAAAGAGAAGISVAMAEKSSAVSASASGSIGNASSLDIIALSEGSVLSKSTAAAGGLVGAGTGAGADAFDRSVVRAYIANDTAVDADAVNVEATAKPQTRAEALGVAVSAGVGIGASVALAEAETDVAAYIGNRASITTNSLDVLARSITPDSGQTAYAKATGGSGGFLFGANATVAEAASENTVRAYVHQGATVTTAGSVAVSASNTSEQDAEAFGIAAGLIAAGANVAHARSNSITEARFDGKLQGVPMVRVYDYVAKRYVYVPLDQFTGDTADTELRIYTDSDGFQWVQYRDPIGGKYRYATLAAYNSANPVPENENNTGKPVEDHVASADYEHPVMVFLTQDLKVTAAGEDDNFAKAIAGSGGVVAGHAATVSTTNTSRTIATLQSAGSTDILRANNIEIDAAHIARFNTEVDSVNAAVLGASGSMARNTVSTDTDATIGANAQIEAHDLTVRTTDTIRKDWLGDYNVRAAGGGVLSGAAAGSVTNVTQSTDVIVGAGAAVKVVGSRNADHLFDIAAINDFEIRDRVKLDTGGAINVTLTESEINVTNSEANVTVQGNADMDSVAGMNLYAVTHGRADAQANAKTYGVAAVAEGDSRARVTASQTISVGSNASLRADGEIRLGAGRTPDGTPNDIFAVAQTDIWNKAAAPITIIGAGGRVNETATIDLATGSKVRGVTDITLLAEKGVIGGSGRYVGMDMYRKAAQEAANAVGDLVGGGESSWALQGGNSTTEGSSSVVVNGLVESGIQNQQYLIIGWDKDEQTHYIKNVSDEGITYTVSEETLAQGLQRRLDELYALRDEHTGNVDAVTAYNLEIQRIEEQLRALTGAGGGDFSSRDVVVEMIDVAPILAAAGNIRVEGDRLTGNGKLISPGDAKIEVINETPYFLRVSDLIIPDHPGGLIRFNGSTVTDNTSINALNPGGSGANFNEVVTGENSPEPSIVVKNTFDPDAVGSGAPAGTIAPDIYIDGDVRNMQGEVNVQAVAGSVVANGVINAKTINLSAGRDFVLGYTEGFRHIGGSPEALWADVTRKLETGEYFVCGDNICKWEFGPNGIPFQQVVASRGSRNSSGSLVAGNNVYISGRYLNINGTIQSGLPDWTLDIGNLDSQIANAEKLYAQRLAAGNADPYIQLLNWSQGNDPKQTRKVTAWWNAKEDRIELDGIKVEGGYMELFGQIMSTGGGHLKVLDGYGTINITNNSGRDIALRTLDVGNGVEGTIKITDLGKSITRDGKTHNLTTVYKRIGSDISVWDNGTVDENDNPTRLVQTFGNTRNLNASQGYKPEAGQRYYWVTGEAKTDYEKFHEEKATKEFIGINFSWLIPDNYSYSNPKWRWSVDGRSLAEGQYTKDLGSTQYDGYEFSKSTADTTDWKYGEWVKWDKCTDRKWLIGCVERTFYAEQTRWKGTKDFFTHSVDADHGIAISFIGSDNGLINVNSNAGVLLGGLINNPNGTTTINANTIVERLTDDALIISKDLTLTAGKGIGTTTVAGTLAGVNMDVTGNLTATSTSGDIVLKDVAGDLNAHRITTGNGNVDVTAQNNLYLTGTGATNVIRGNEITLTATNGSIGKSNAAVNIDTGTGDKGLFTASAANGIYVKETDGDLRLNTVHAGGDVYIEAVNGNITDGNRNDVRDTRAEEQLLALWDQMDLIGADAEAAAERGVEAYAQGKEQEYQQYWKMRNARQDGNGDWVADAYDDNFSFAFSAEERNFLKQQNGLSDAQIADIEAQKTADYQRLHAEFGAGSYDPNFQYVADAAKRAELTEGAAWTANQLKYAVSKGAFSGSGDTEMRIETANVKGNNVTLVANNGGIGSTLADDVIIDLSGGIASLTEAQRIALASAERDDVSFEGPDGKIIRIVQRDDVDVETTAGGITALAKNEIFLGGEKDINVTNVQSPIIRIKAGESIIDTQAGTPAIRGGEVILEASGGSLGAAGNPLDVAIAGKFTARAQQDINLVQHDGGVLIDRFNAGGDLTLNVLNGGIAQLNGTGVTLTGANVNLITQGSVGAPSDAVSVQHGPGGSLQATTGGDLYITGESLALGTSNVGGQIDVTATVDTLSFVGDVQSGGNATYTAYTDALLDDGATVRSTAGSIRISADDVTMGTGSHLEAGEQVLITADEDVQVAQITAHRANGDAIVIDAQGAITGDGGSDLTATSAGANVVLNAGQGIGTAAQALNVEAPKLDATAPGDLHLHMLANTHASQVLSTDGTVNIGSDADFDYDLIRGKGDVHLDVAGVLVGDTLQSTDASIVVESGSANLANVGASTDATITTAGDQTLGAATTGGDQTLTAGGALNADTLTVGGVLSATAASADIDAADVTGTAVVTTSGNQVIGALTTGDRMTLDAGGDLTYTTLTGDENLVATAGGHIQGGNADFGGNAVIDAGSADLTHLQTGDSANVTTTGDLTIDEVIAATSLTVDAENATVQFGDAGTTAQVTSAQDQAIGMLVTGGDMTLNAGRDIVFTNLVSGNDLTGTAVRDIRGGSATAAGHLSLNAGRDLDVGDLTATAGRMTLDVTGDATYGALEGGENLVAAVGGHLQGGDADFVGTITIDAGSADLDHVQTDVDATITTTADLTIDEVIAGTTLTVNADGDTTLGTATSTDDQQFHVDGLLTAGVLTSHTGAIDIGDAATQTGSADIATANAATTFTIHTSGDQTLGTITTGGDQSLNAGGTITAGTLVGQSNLDVLANALVLDQGTFEGDATVYTAGDQQIGTLDTEGSIRLETQAGNGGDIVYGHLEAGAPETVGATEERLTAPSITVIADGELRRLTSTTGDAHAEGMLDMKAYTFDVGDLKSAGADVILEATVDVVADLAHAKRDLKVTAGNDMRIGEVNYGGEMSLFAGRNLWAKVGGDIKFAVAEVGGNADLASGGEIAFDSLKAGGHVNLDAAGDVTIDDFVEAGESISVVSGGEANIGTLTSTNGSITVQAAGDVHIDAMSATQGAADVSGANVHVNALAGNTSSVDAIDTLRIGTAHIGERLDLAGRDVVAKVIQTRPVDPFVMNLTGHAGGLADVADLHITTSNEVAFGKVYGKRVHVQTTGDRISIDDAYVPGVLNMETPVAKLVAQNLSVAPVPGVDVQMHEQDYRFRLKQAGTHTDTNAYVLRYSPGYTVSVPNFSEDHVDGGPLVRGESALMYTERLGSMALNNAVGDDGADGGSGVHGNQTGEQENPFSFPRWPQGLLNLEGVFGPAALPLTQPDTPAVNVENDVLGLNGFDVRRWNMAMSFGGMLLTRMFGIESNDRGEE